VTAAQFAAAQPATEVWPAELVQAFTAQQRRRGRQRTAGRRASTRTWPRPRGGARSASPDGIRADGPAAEVVDEGRARGDL
jgi:hypothetical protein